MAECRPCASSLASLPRHERGRPGSAAVRLAAGRLGGLRGFEEFAAAHAAAARAAACGFSNK